MTNTAMTAPAPAQVGGMSEDQKTSQAALRAQEVQALAEFARYIISEYCWGYSSEPDGGDVQDVAERLGLIEPHIATAEDAAEHTDFEPGDTIYKFATWLNQPRGLSAGEAPSAETVNSSSQAIASDDEGDV